jgi:hypothetical protein
MITKNASRVVKLFSAVLLFAGMGSAHAVATDLGTVSDGSYGFGRALNFGETFTDYVNFDLDSSADVTSFIKSFDMSVFGFDLVGIDNFTTGLQKLGSGGGYTSVASFTSNPASFDDLLSPGAYRFSVAGTASGFFGGIYRGTLHVAAVPEADTWVMLLVGLGLVAYQLRRKQRSLEQRPTTLAAAA